MNHTEVMAALKEILSANIENLNVDSINESSVLANIDGLNSLTLVMILFEVEARFGAPIDDPTMLVTIGDVVDFVVANQTNED